LVCLGRRDDQVKVRGFRIELGEVEAGLLRCAGVNTAVAAIQPDQHGDNQLIGFWVGTAETEAEGIRQTLRRFLPEYMVPTVLVRVTAVPLTQNGKADRQALLRELASSWGYARYQPRLCAAANG
jgi:acyl-coenzyme A synthetase/AMP-(fatty) acid ligase